VVRHEGTQPSASGDGVVPKRVGRSVTGRSVGAVVPAPDQRLLDDGRYASINELAPAERIERGYLGTLLRLTLLAPEFVEGILNGCAAC
jgi:hypothetical protein